MVGNPYTQWVQGTTTVNFGPGITIDSQEVTDESHIVADINIWRNVHRTQYTRGLRTIRLPYGYPTPVQLLSPREQDVLKLLAQGYTNQEAGTRMCLSVKTIETYRVRIVDKLDLRSRADLTRYALEMGLLNPAPSSPG